MSVSGRVYWWCASLNQSLQSPQFQSARVKHQGELTCPSSWLRRMIKKLLARWATAKPWLLVLHLRICSSTPIVVIIFKFLHYKNIRIINLVPTLCAKCLFFKPSQNLPLVKALLKLESWRKSSAIFCSEKSLRCEITTKYSGNGQLV